LLLFLITACTSLPYKQQKQQTQLSERQFWFLKARVAIKTKEENVSANLEWEKTGNDFDFHIYGMFGATYTHLTQEGQKATLKLPEDQVFYHQNAQQLMQDNLGWDFPINALSYWIKGLPSGKEGETIRRNAKGLLQTISFRGWLVTFSRYQDFSGYQMPKMLKAKHPQMSLKIAVKKWNFAPVE